jgi:hypothetical protein
MLKRMDARNLAVAVAPTGRPTWVGRTFVSPLFDYLVIGGPLSLVAVGAFLLIGPMGVTPAHLVWVILFANSAHFAASTLRLYTKPGAVRQWPFLSLGLPVVAVLVATAAIAGGAPFARYLLALYIFWSPYHYSAQAFGLSMIYAHRSGQRLGGDDKRLLRVVCLMSFFWTLIQPEGGLSFLVSPAGWAAVPTLTQMRDGLSRVLWALTLAMPAIAFVHLKRTRNLVLPAICLVMIYTNAAWFLFFPYVNAFFWATVFHAVQYLAIVLIFHVKEQLRRPGNAHGWPYHALRFYVPCLALGYVLFDLWPRPYGEVGFDPAQAALLVAAVINVHHFIVDAYIWRISRDRNYENVLEAARPAGAGAASPS